MELESRHDAHKLGDLIAAGAPGEAAALLASLADLVRHVMRGDGHVPVPLRIAAAKVLDAVQYAAPLPVMYCTEPGGYAHAVSPDLIVRKARQAQPKRFDLQRPRGFTAGAWGGGTTACSVVERTEVSACDELKGAAGILVLLRQFWCEQATSPDQLAEPWAARLAIRRDVADDLFDCGPERSFWDVPLQTAPPGHSSQWPPAGLEGLPNRTPARHREAKTDDVPPRPVVLLAELVQLIEGRDGLPVKRAASAVIDALKSGGPLQFFALVKGDLARTVSDADVWRRGFLSGAAQLATWNSLSSGDYGIIVPLWSLDDDERRARGMVLGPDEYNGLTEEQLRPLPAIPELAGAGGLVEWLRVCWVQDADLFDQLDIGPHAGVSILADDAVRLFGRFTQSINAGATFHRLCSDPLQIVDRPAEAIDTAALRNKVDCHRKVSKTGRRWPDKSKALAELLTQYNDRMALPDAVSDTAEEKIADLWGLSKNTVHTYLTEARKAPAALRSKGAA